MSASCAILPLRNVLDELIDEAAHSFDLVEVQENDSDVSFRAASFLDDYLFRPSPLEQISLYQFVMNHFRRKRIQSTAPAALFLPEHPLFGTHCVGTHTTEVVPIVTGTRMPYLDSESPRDIIIKRSQCALVLFKAFRAATDLVADPSNGEEWVQAYYRLVPTPTSFTREIMANMDDYYIAAKQAKERGEEAVAEVSAAELDCNANNEGITGTRADVDAALDSIAMDEAVHSGADRNDDLFNLSSDDNDDAVTNDDSDADAASLDNEPSLHVFPNSRFESADLGCAYQTLLGGAAQSTVGTMADMRNRCQTLDFTIAELQQFSSDPSSDAERLQSHRFCDERPTEVIELIASALESNCVWSPPQATPDNRPLQPYASIIQVSTAFTLNQRQHQAFTIITTSLLRRFLHQELGDDGGGYRTDNFEARFRDDQLLMYLGGPGGSTLTGLPSCESPPSASKCPRPPPSAATLHCMTPSSAATLRCIK